MTKEYIEYAPLQVRAFLRAHVLDGATARYLEDPSANPQAPARRNRSHELTVNYYNCPQSLRAFGQQSGGITGERIRQIIDKTLNGLNAYASSEVKNQYPADIPKDKTSEQNTVIGRGLERGCKAAKVITLIKEGKPIEEIAQIVGKPNLRVIMSRFAKRAGLDTPYSQEHRLSLAISKEMQNPNLTFEQIQGLWANLTLSKVSGGLKKDGLVLSLSSAVALSGMHIKPCQTETFLPYLSRAKVAIGHFQKVVKDKNGQTILQNYYLLRKVDLEKAILALRQEEALRAYFENPVRQISGPEGLPIPTTTQLVHKRGFGSLNNLSRVLGVNFAHNGRPISPEKFLVGCPVPVYQQRKRNSAYLYPTPAETALAEFIQSKKAQLGI